MAHLQNGCGFFCTNIFVDRPARCRASLFLRALLHQVPVGLKFIGGLNKTKREKIKEKKKRIKFSTVLWKQKGKKKDTAPNWETPPQNFTTKLSHNLHG
jgi:hypothetical protein